MKCLLCDKELSNGGNIVNLIFDEDVICYKCRKDLNYKPIILKIKEQEIYSLYLYDEHLSRLILQYKESYDEALYIVFLYPYVSKLKKRYQGYTVVLAPSSIENLNRRGFNHLQKIFEILGLPILDCLYKDLNINQNNLSFSDREKIIDHILVKDVKLPEKVLLVDDILTSGSTIIGCLKALENKTSDIKVLTIAYNKSYLTTS